MSNDDWRDIPLDKNINDWSDIPEQKDISQLESLGRGALAGGSLGFSDEVTGAGESAIQSLLESLNLTPDDKLSMGEKYRQERDESRASNLAAQEANPWTYGAGNLAGAVGTGLAAGGAGLIGKGAGALGATGTEAALASAAAGGTARGLMTIGALEGAAAGLGSSEADLTKGELGEAAVDTAIGAGLGAGTAGLIKGGQKLYQGAKSVAKATPVLGKVGTHLSDVYEEGSKNLGKSFDTAASESLDEITDSAEDLAAKALAQKESFRSQLGMAKDLSGNEVRSKVINLSGSVKEGLKKVGTEIEEHSNKISKFAQDLPDHLKITDDGLQVGKFDFSDLDQFFDEGIREYKGQPAANILENMKNELSSADYTTVEKQLRKINELMGQYEGTTLTPVLKKLKEGIQNTTDLNLQKLPGKEGQQLWKQKRDLDTKYSRLKTLEDTSQTTLGANTKATPADLGEKATFMNTPGNLRGIDYTKQLEVAEMTNDPKIINAARELKEAAGKWNQYNLDPELGKIGLGKDEDLYQIYKEVFGEPTKYGVSKSTATSIEDLNQRPGGITSNKKKQDLIKWIEETYGDKADEVLAELRARSKKFQTLKAGLDDNIEAGQDFSSWIRGMKKAADPLAFMAGKSGQHIANTAEKFGVQNLGKATSPLRTIQTYRNLTQPENYKKTVEEFKQSQQNNGVVPENE